MIRINFTDLGTGTTGTISLTGSQAGSTNELFLAKHAWGMGFEALSVAGSRVGDGSIALTGLTSGSYYAFARSKVGLTEELSIPLSFRLPSQELSLQERCANAIRDFVLGLQIPGVATDPEQHVVAKVGEKFDKVVESKSLKQAVFYLWAPETYSVANASEDFVKIPVVVSWIQKSSQGLVTNKTAITRFREIIHRSMAICELSEVPEVYSVSFLPGAVIDPSQWIENSDATNMTVNLIAEVQAGII